MPTNKQRRENERRRLQKQLEVRRRQEAARHRRNLIFSIVGTVVLIAAVVVIVVVATGGKDKKKPAAAGASSATPTPSASASSAPASPSTAPAKLPTAPCAAVPKTGTVEFKGVTIKNALATTKAPVVTSKAKGEVPSLQCQDIVLGKGAAATPTSKVTVQYYGALYTNGKKFDASWTDGTGAAKGKPVAFPLNQVVPGFGQAIGGAGPVKPMRVGGRRVVIIPSSLGYGAQASGPIPANSSLVFVIDLTKLG